MTTILGKGVYTFPEAARLTGLRRARVREWFLGRPWEARRKPVFRGDFEDFPEVISFLDLVEVFVAGQLREHGVSLQTLRRVHERMRRDLHTNHPFGRKELLTDGKQVLMRGLDDQGRDDLVEVLTKQKVFTNILLPFLQRVEYDATTRLATKWHIAKGVVVNPAICFGRPIIEAVSIPTEIIAAAYQANQRDAELVADWYDVHPDQVIAAVEFETNMAA